MLPQKPAPRGRKLKLRRFVAWSGLPFLGVVTTFGALPQAGTDPSQTRTVIEEVTLPRAMPSASATSFWRNERVQDGDSVAELLSRLNVEDSAAENFLRTSRAAASFRKLAAGTSVRAETDANGGLLALRYLASSNSQTLIEKAGSGFIAKVLPAQLEQRLFIRTGEIKTTLFAATDEANLPEPAANQLADIFGSEIDFHHELKPGDRFSVIYEVPYNNGEPVYAGRILATEFTNKGKSYRALYFQTDREHGDYYTPEGDSVRKTFLRSPVEFSRISSGFTSARLDPILHKWRAHKGVDFAAPIGTKVKATAEGTVAFVGEQTGYGNVVIVKHQGRYSTVYGHLSRFARNLHTGQHVIRGEIIGYVGVTGWTTGPHLHYEFKVNGKQRNPLRRAPQDAPPIAETQKAAFLAATRDLNARLGMLRNVTLAQLN